MRNLIKIAAAGAALTVALPVAAAPASTTPVQLRVDYSDLDISKLEDAVTLDRRIYAAAVRACTTPTMTTIRLVDRACVTNLVTAAREQVAVTEADGADRVALN